MIIDPGLSLSLREHRVVDIVPDGCCDVVLQAVVERILAERLHLHLLEVLKGFVSNDHRLASEIGDGLVAHI